MENWLQATSAKDTSRFQNISPMTRKIVALVFGMVSLAATAVGQRATWTVQSSSKIDSRIERQLRAIALQELASIRFRRGVNRSERLSQRQCLITLEQVDESRFLAKLKEETASSQVPSTVALAEEGYILRISYRPDFSVKQVRIAAESSTGLHNAVLRIPEVLKTAPADLLTKLLPRLQAVRRGNDGEVVIADYPAFQIRGVIEGFYGPPWSHEDRLDMLRFEGQHRLFNGDSVLQTRITLQVFCT